MVESLFSYRKGSSAVHMCSPLIKLFLLLFFSISIFSQYLFDSELFLWSKTAFFFLGAIGSVFYAGIPISRIKNLRIVILLGFFVTLFKIIQIEVVNGNFNVGFDIAQISDGLLYTARFFTASLFALVFFETTSPLEIQESLEIVQDSIAKIIPPLKKVSLALYVSLAISFIPEIFSVWKNIRLASRARTTMHAGRKKSFVKAITIFAVEFSALLSIMIGRAVQKRKALLNRMQYGR